MYRDGLIIDNMFNDVMHYIRYKLWWAMHGYVEFNYEHKKEEKAKVSSLNRYGLGISHLDPDTVIFDKINNQLDIYEKTHRKDLSYFNVVCPFKEDVYKFFKLKGYTSNEIERELNKAKKRKEDKENYWIEAEESRYSHFNVILERLLHRRTYL